jgi:hypothetical protein
MLRMTRAGIVMKPGYSEHIGNMSSKFSAGRDRYARGAGVWESESWRRAMRGRHPRMGFRRVCGTVLRYTAISKEVSTFETLFREHYRDLFEKDT